MQKISSVKNFLHKNFLMQKISYIKNFFYKKFKTIEVNGIIIAYVNKENKFFINIITFQ